MKKTLFSVMIAFLAVTAGLWAQGPGARPQRMSWYQDNYFICGIKYGFLDFNNAQDTNNQIKYQFSIKYLLDFDRGNWLKSDLFNLYFIYTQKHFWNIFDASSPFKEINFAPGLLANFNFDIPVLYRIDLIPLLHESNGDDGTDSRSWNRMLLTLGLLNLPFLQLDATGFMIYNLNLSPYNADIFHYSGFFEAEARISDDLEDPLFELDYVLRYAPAGLTHVADFKLALFHILSPRLPKDVMLHLQFHHGYLESLETYSQKTARIRLGVSFH